MIKSSEDEEILESEIEKLKYLVRLMVMIEDNPEKLTSDYLKNISPSILFPYFIQFCIGGKEPYVEEIGEGLLRLTQPGIRKLDELKERLSRMKSTQEQTLFNKIIALTSSVVALYYLLSLLGVNTIFVLFKPPTNISLGIQLFLAILLALFLIFVVAHLSSIISKLTLEDTIKKIFRLVEKLKKKVEK